MKRKLILLSVIALVFALSVATATMVFADTDATFSDISIQENYCKNDTMEIPVVTMNVGGRNYETKAVLHQPNGKAKFVSGNAILSEFGQYSLEYVATVNGVTYNTEKSFYVYQPKFELSSPEDEVYYEDNGVDGAKGEFVSLSQDQTLTINDYFDITKSSLTKPLFEAVVLPAEIGKEDFQTLQIDLICKNDQSQYLRLIVNYNPENNCTYTMAGSQDQTPTGFEQDGERLHVGDNWGAAWHGTFSGRFAKDKDQIYSDVKIWLDYQSKVVYANVAKGFVIDLDDSQYFSNLWTGFEENEVFVRISASRFQATKPARFIILRAGDIDLTEQKIFDTTAPDIDIDYGGVDEDDLPIGVVGYDYPLFEATSIDYMSGECVVQVRVKSRDNTTGGVELSVKNSSFTPISAGEHVITYTSTDRSGNVATKVLTVNVVDEYAAPQMKLTNIKISAKNGEFVKLADVEPSNCIGTAKIEKKVYFEDKEILTSGDGFRPGKVGEYTVYITVTDYLGRIAQRNYTVFVSENDKAVFIDRIDLPHYLIAGSEYNFDNVYAYDYSVSGQVRKIKATLVTEDANGIIEHVDDKFIPSVATHLDTVKLYYKATVNGSLSKSEEFTIPVCVVGSSKDIDISKYFVSADAAIEKSSAGTVITTSKDKTSVEFANFLLAHGASYEFDVDGTKNAFNKINVYLTDVLNEEEVVKITYEKSSETKSYFSVNGGTKYEMAASFYGKGENSFAFKYDNEQFTVTDTSKITFGVTKYLNGEKFKGFTSGRVSIVFEFEDVRGESSIIVSKINGQNTTSVKADLIKPRIALDSPMEFRYKLNDVVEISTALAMDVLDPNIECYYTVTGIGGQIMKDVDGVLLENVSLREKHTVKLDKYGVYRVSYFAADWNNKKETDFGYIMEVVDLTPPVIAVFGNVQKTAKVGDRMNVPKVVAIDEIDGETEVTIFVMLPDGSFRKYDTAVSEYKMQGKYTFWIYTFDLAGNTSVNTYEVTVQ